MDCLFCKIIAGEIPSTKVYEDELVYAFEDINPQAPVHVLVNPENTHCFGGRTLREKIPPWVAHIFEVTPGIAKKLELKNGFRVVTNCGDDGAQTVKHLHFHIMGGRPLQGQMG